MTIGIKALTFETIIGLLEHERNVPQRIVVDCKIDYHYENSFINYAEVAELIKSTMQEGRFELIEEALESLHKTLKTHFPAIEKLKIKIEKPDILPACRVSATLKRKFKEN